MKRDGTEIKTAEHLEKKNITKIICIILQSLLLVWFFLDMTGMTIGGRCLVTRSYQDDGIFFLIYLAAFLLFLFWNRIGRWAVAGFSTLWFVTQFICHEWYTIFNGGFMGSLQGKIDYFADTIHWITAEGRYIPDLYHTILHVLILSVVISTFIFIRTDGRRETEQ